MKGVLRSAAITAILAVLAGAGGIFLGARLLQPSAPPSLHDLVHGDLDLTSAQETEIEALEASFASRKTKLEAEMRAANAELARAIQANEAMGPEVEAAVRHVHEAMGTLQTDTIQHVFGMRHILTPDQRARFDRMVVKALTSQEE